MKHPCCSECGRPLLVSGARDVCPTKTCPNYGKTAEEADK